jgi:hypothetical protein
MEIRDGTDALLSSCIVYVHCSWAYFGLMMVSHPLWLVFCYTFTKLNTLSLPGGLKVALKLIQKYKVFHWYVGGVYNNGCLF